MAIAGLSGQADRNADGVVTLEEAKHALETAHRNVLAASLGPIIGIPALMAAGITELPSALDGVEPGPVVVGTAVSFVVGYASIAWLLRLVASRSIVFFVPYRIALGVVVLAVLAVT